MANDKYLITGIKNNSNGMFEAVIQCGTSDLESAQAIANALRSTGHADVGVREWSKKQRHEVDIYGRMRWRAGYIQAAM